MIDNRIVPNINIFSNSLSSVNTDGFSKPVLNVNETGGSSFKDILSGLVSSVDADLKKPDQLLQQQMAGNPDVDIHDVITAIAKADLGVTMAVQMTSKAVQAYNSVMNISI